MQRLRWESETMKCNKHNPTGGGRRMTLTNEEQQHMKELNHKVLSIKQNPRLTTDEKADKISTAMENWYDQLQEDWRMDLKQTLQAQAKSQGIKALHAQQLLQLERGASRTNKHLRANN